MDNKNIKLFTKLSAWFDTKARNYRKIPPVSISLNIACFLAANIEELNRVNFFLTFSYFNTYEIDLSVKW